MHVKSVDLFGLGARIHHVGLVVAGIDQALPGLAKIHDPVQRVNVAFIDMHGSTIEFIEPADGRSPVAASLKKNIKLVHLCYSVPDINAAIAHAESLEARLIAAPVPAVAFDGALIAWMFHPIYGLIELLEDKS